MKVESTYVDSTFSDNLINRKVNTNEKAQGFTCIFHRADHVSYY